MQQQQQCINMPLLFISLCQQVFSLPNAFSASADSIIVCMLFCCLFTAVRKWLHEPRLHWIGRITNHIQWNIYRADSFRFIWLSYMYKYSCIRYTPWPSSRKQPILTFTIIVVSMVLTRYRYRSSIAPQHWGTSHLTLNSLVTVLLSLPVGNIMQVESKTDTIAVHVS